MMINFNDRNIYVQYIQNFLKQHYNKNLILSDVYDIPTHKALIEYLKLPEIIDSNKMKNILLEHYTFRDEDPPNKLYNGGGIWNFNHHMTPNYIEFYTKPIHECYVNGRQFITDFADDIKEFCKQYGWVLLSYNIPIHTKGKNIDTTITFTLVKESREQLLPCKDIINMINLSTNEYMLNKCFIDENNAYHGFVQDSQYYKILYIDAKPGDTFTIAHGYSMPCEIAIAYTEHSLKEIREDGYTVNNIVSYMEKSPNGMLNSDDYVIYSIPEDAECTYLLIQVPFLNSLLYRNNKTFKVKIGDINEDGIINEDDLNILKKYVDYKSGKTSIPFTLSDVKLIAANINKDYDSKGYPIVNEYDVTSFENALQYSQEHGTQIDFGETIYQRPTSDIETKLDKILVMYGDINQDNTDNELNIPIHDFKDTPWSIHEEFLPFILGSAIHKYSNIEDITQLQENIQKLFGYYGKYKLTWGKYDEPKDYIANETLTYNPTKGFYEYRNQGLYTGYILNTNDPTNGDIIYEDTKRPTGVKIINGRWLESGQWNGKLVLGDGTICTEYAQYSLREIVKLFQIKINKVYKEQTSDEIKFINGYVNPITEKYLNNTIYDYNK